jgi:acylphosphatase
MRWRLQSLRREIYFAPSAFRRSADEMPGVQTSGPQSTFDIQFANKAQTALGFGREKSRVHRFKTRQQRRIRKAIARRLFWRAADFPAVLRLSLLTICGEKTLRRGNSFGFIRRVFSPGADGANKGVLKSAGNDTLDGCGMKRSRMHIFYSGRVQGVGFRYTVKSVVAGFEVTGTVRNLADGRVELVAEGQREELEAFRSAIRDAGLEHFIRNEDVNWSETENGFRGFEIVR